MKSKYFGFIAFVALLLAIAGGTRTFLQERDYQTRQDLGGIRFLNFNSDWMGPLRKPEFVLSAKKNSGYTLLDSSLNLRNMNRLPTAIPSKPGGALSEEGSLTNTDLVPEMVIEPIEVLRGGASVTNSSLKPGEKSGEK